MKQTLGFDLSERLTEGGDLQRQWNKRLCNKLELDQHYQADQIQAVIPGRRPCVRRLCVCSLNLFIYLSLAAIMVFIPSLCLSLSCDGGLGPVSRLIITPVFSHQTLIRPITRVTESTGVLMWRWGAIRTHTHTHFGIKRSVSGYLRLLSGTAIPDMICQQSCQTN